MIVEKHDVDGQGRHWSRHSNQYSEVFLDPFLPDVENPVLKAIEAIPSGTNKAVIDLGCGTGPLLPRLMEKFNEVYGLDFAPGMIRKAKARLGKKARSVVFLNRKMEELEDYQGRFDVAVAMNSVVMPDVREIDRTLLAIRRSLKPDGLFVGAVPAIDAIQYHTMLLMDRALARGEDAAAAEQSAAEAAEHTYYDFAFGRFAFQGLWQKFWHSFEVEYRLRKAGFRHIQLGKVLYPWDANVYGGEEFEGEPRSWDWSFLARG